MDRLGFLWIDWLELLCHTGERVAAVADHYVGGTQMIDRSIQCRLQRGKFGNIDLLETMITMKTFVQISL